MVLLAKKVANYKVKDILKNFKEIIKFIVKYKQNVEVKIITNALTGFNHESLFLTEQNQKKQGIGNCSRRIKQESIKINL